MKKLGFEDDPLIIERCINGDLPAWAIFAKRYSELISLSIKNRLKKHGFSLPVQDIEDIKQDILTSIWHEQKLEGVKNRGNISYWLAIVSGNAAMEYMRKRRSSDQCRQVSISQQVDGCELADLIPAAGTGQLKEAALHEISERIECAIETMPAKEKLIARLFVSYGKKYHEIADMLNMPKGTVSSYIKRAREKLKKSLADLQQF